MNSLMTILNKTLQVLSSLSIIMDEEQEQLSGGYIDSNRLLRVTEDKSALLKTLSYLDNMRRQTEKQTGQRAPYSQHDEQAMRWAHIMKLASQLRDTNIHNGMLLTEQQKFNKQALAILAPHHSDAFYGPDGQGKPHVVNGHKL